MIVKQIRVRAKMRDGTTKDVVGDELKAFRASFIVLVNKPVDFALILPEDVERYLLEAIETEINDTERIVRRKDEDSYN